MWQKPNEKLRLPASDDLQTDGCVIGPSYGAIPSSPGTSDCKSLSTCDSTADSGFLSEVLSENISSTNLSSADMRDQISCSLPSEQKSHSRAYYREDSGVDIDLSGPLGQLNISEEDLKPRESAKTCIPDPDSMDAALRERLIQQVYSQDSDGYTVLHIAIIQGFIEAVFSLIRLAPHPRYLDLTTDSMMTALHLAVYLKHPLIIRRLILAGAKVDAQDYRGYTPLHLATELGDLASAKQLLTPIKTEEIKNMKATGVPPTQLPQDLEITNEYGQTCAHIAAYHGQIEIMRNLYCYGIDVNKKCKCAGRSPLHLAVSSRHPATLDMLRFLVSECQADLEVVSWQGLTPYQQVYIESEYNPQRYTNIANQLLFLGAESKYVHISDEEDSDMDSDFDETMDGEASNANG